MQSAGHEERMCRAESTCTGLLKYSPHSPGNCSRSASALLPPSFALPPSCTSLNFSHLFACFFVLFLVCLLLFSTSLVTPSTTPISSSFHNHFVTVTFLCCFLSLFFIFIIIPHPHLSIPLLSPVRLEWRITEIPSWLSWIGYADVTDTTAPHKYTAYYLPLLQYTYKAWDSSRLTSCLIKYMGFMRHVSHSV